MVELQHRLGEDAGQIERAGIDAELGLAAGLAGIELDRGIVEAGTADRVGLRRRPRREREARENPLHAIVLGRVERAAPARAELRDHALRMQVGEQRAQGRAERNAGRDLGHDSDVEPVRSELAGVNVVALGPMPGEVEIALRPAHAVAGEETEAAHRHADAIALFLGADAALDLLEGERLDALVEPQRDLSQRDIDGGADRLAIAKVEPASQGAVAFAQLERQRHMLAELAHVGPRQVGEGAAAPAAPVPGASEERLRESAAQAEAIAPTRRRRRVDTQVVLAQAVAHHQLDVGQRQRRRMSGFVDPAQRAAANHELLLLEEPVGCGAAVFAAAGAAAEVEPGDADVAGGIAPDVEAGAIDEQLFEADFEREQGARRQRSVDARQGQRRPLLGIENAHVAQLDRRDPAARAGLDRADPHRRAEHAAGPGLDRRTPVVDVRQNQPVK